MLLGTSAEHPDANNGEWREYEFPCKPGDVSRRPCVIAPYHYRLDWQLWFAAMSSIGREPWLVHFIDKLLVGNATAKRLLAVDPFPDAPPRFIRADLYRYDFTRPGDGSRDWWRRTFEGTYLSPVARDDPKLRRYLERFDWN